MNTRAKKKVVVAPGEAEAHEAMRLFAESASRIKGLESEMELEIQKIREAFSPRIAKIKVDYDHSMDQLKAYAEEHRADMFTKKKKSQEWEHGTLGFRTGTPKVAKPRTITWDKIMKALRENSLGHFLRTKEEINKDMIIESREDESVMAQLKEVVGIEVTQDETFFVVPKEEEVAV
ncbi:MAG: host-nuclease inhibitor Gam family protein [Cyclobacteriaceae bacterium]